MLYLNPAMPLLIVSKNPPDMLILVLYLNPAMPSLLIVSKNPPDMLILVLGLLYISSIIARLY